MNLPKIDVSTEELYRMLYAPIKSKLLITGLELKVFDLLSEPKSAEEVSKAIEGHPTNTMLFLNGLVACDLLVKYNGLYKNAPIAQTFLVGGSPTYLGGGFISQRNMSSVSLDNLTKLIKEGPQPSSDDASRSEEEWARFATWMANTERAGVAQQMSDVVSKLPEFSSFGNMLDLGGGPGIFGISMVSKHPSMKGVIFDRQPVVEVAKGFIKEYELEDRIDVLAGDYNCDPIGEGYDFIWSSATLNFAMKNMDTVMKKIYDALNPGGVFINLSEGLTDEGTKPDFYVLAVMGWSMASSIMAFDQGFIADAMIKAGFRSVRSRTLNTGWGPMDMDIARK